MHEATLTFPQKPVLRHGRFGPQGAEDSSKWFLARLRPLEGRLAAQGFLCAGRFTTADVSVGYALLLLAQHVGLADRFTPAVAACWGRLRQRPACRRAQVAQVAAARAQGVSSIASPNTLPL